jgi:hypothetical protein
LLNRISPPVTQTLAPPVSNPFFFPSSWMQIKGLD